MYEPNYESGKAVRWRIYQDGDVPMGVAGLYRRWKDPKGGLLFTFTMLTVNCDTHPFYKRFHKPDDEKRMPIFLRPEEYGPWLMAKVDDAPAFFKQYLGPLSGEPAPLVRIPKLVGEPRGVDEVLPPAKAKPQKTAKPASPPPAPPAQGELF